MRREPSMAKLKGHAVSMRALLNDLRLRGRRNVLKDILEHAVPTILQDVVIIFVTVSGHKKWRYLRGVQHFGRRWVPNKTAPR